MDEYDKPVLDALEVPGQARANRDALRALYSTIKDCDEHIRFAFLTGVSQFSKVSVFSGLNNLIDLTWTHPTRPSVATPMKTWTKCSARSCPAWTGDAVRDWYNGYNWLGEERVYNPFDILQLFRSRRFRAYWFETGTPAFLVGTLLKRGIATPSLDGLVSTQNLLSAFDVDNIGTEALLFQTGYLTIAKTEDRLGDTLLRLGYPNREVRQSLNQTLLSALLPQDSSRLDESIELVKQLASNDFTGLEASIRTLFASIPYNWHVRNDNANYEATTPACSTPTSLQPDWNAGGGRRQQRPSGHGRALKRQHLSLRVQSGGTLPKAQPWRNSRKRAAPTSTGNQGPHLPSRR